MKVTGESFSFHHERKRAEEARYQRYPNFQAKGPLPDRTLESFCKWQVEMHLARKTILHLTKIKKWLNPPLLFEF